MAIGSNDQHDNSGFWWQPERHQDRRPFLLARNEIRRALDLWFAQEGFIQVDPALLQHSPGNELHLHAFGTDRRHTDGSHAETLYLHTSPEFAMKKLIAAGESKIFTFTHAFRNRETGPLHSPEFTMLEWYRTGATLEDLMADCQTILKIAMQAAGNSILRHKQDIARIEQPKYMSVCHAFSKLAGVDLLATLADPAQPNVAALRDQTHVRTADDDDWSDIFTRILVEIVEPGLPRNRPTYLYDYPKPEAALARSHDTDPRLARRFELYACGLELANAFEELTDAAEQRARFEADMAAKVAIYGERYPIDDALLAALPHMPPTAGIALGFDRLVMLATGADRIDQVMWSPVGG